MEHTVAPLGGRLGPDDFQTAGGGVFSIAGPERVGPPEVLLLDGSPLRRRAVGAGRSTVRLAESMPADDESGRLRVVHAHAAKGNTDIQGRLLRVGVSIGALGVDVDKPMVGGSKGLFQLVGAVHDISATVVPDVVTLGDEGGLGAPVDTLIGLPHVSAATAKAESGESHGLESNVSRQ